MMPNTLVLRYFVEVAHTGNVSRAADRLGITQPSLSLAIQRLESSLGVKLLLRSNAGVKLTRAGQQFLIEARHLSQEWDRICTNAIRDDKEVSGRYVFGCHPSLGTFALPLFMRDLLAQFPRLELNLVHDLSRRLTEDVISYKIDFAIVANPISHPDLVLTELFSDYVTFWVGEKSLEHQDPALDLHSKTATLICDPEMPQTQPLLKAATKQGMCFGRTINASNLEVIVSLISGKAGIGILPSRVARRIPSLGLVEASPDAPRWNDRLCLIYRADAQGTRAARFIADFIATRLRRNCASEKIGPSRLVKSRSR